MKGGSEWFIIYLLGLADSSLNLMGGEGTSLTKILHLIGGEYNNKENLSQR